MKNIVEPYIIIISPDPVTPTLKASAAASIVPELTIVPSAKPVSLDALAETSPITSSVQTSLGNCSRSIKSLISSLLQSCLLIS